MARTRSVSRREFIAGTVAATAAGPLLATAATAQDQTPAPAAITRKVKLGVVGLGGRGHWIAGLFAKHGGYDMHAVADYFPHVADEQGTALGVDPSRRFSGLSGYKRLIESGIEAIALEDFRYSSRSRWATRSTPDCTSTWPSPSLRMCPVCSRFAIRRSARPQSSASSSWITRCRRIRTTRKSSGRSGAAASAVCRRCSAPARRGPTGFDDPPFTENLESRLQKLIWVNDDALGCGYIGNYDIHVIDIVLRALGRFRSPPTGGARATGAEPHGDALDSVCTMFTFDDGMVLEPPEPEEGTASSGSRLTARSRPRSRAATPAHGCPTGARPTFAAVRITCPAARWRTSTRPAPFGTSPRSTRR